MRTAGSGVEILRGGERYGAADVPSDELTVDFYETAVDRLASIGIAQYEISNFARPGCESLHNLKYWTLEPYAGFGADAHSYDGSVRSRNVESPAEYVERFERGESACEETIPGRRGEERFFLGLRLRSGMRANGRGMAPVSRRRSRDLPARD